LSPDGAEAGWCGCAIGSWEGGFDTGCEATDDDSDGASEAVDSVLARRFAACEFLTPVTVARQTAAAATPLRHAYASARNKRDISRVNTRGITSAENTFSPFLPRITVNGVLALRLTDWLILFIVS